MAEDDQPLEKIQISGPTIASLLQRFTSSSGDIHGLLFGHVTHLSPSHLSDDLSTATSTPTAVATITSLISTTFFDSADNLNNILNLSENNANIIGWFSGRRRTHLRPSLRETSVTAALARKHSPCIFLLLTSPPPSEDRNPNPNMNINNNNMIHTHEYRAYQFITPSSKFDPNTLDVVNIGPAFRRHYGSFSPASPFPSLPCDFRGSTSMTEDDHDGSSSKEALEGMGIDVGRLSGLIGPEAVKYTGELEDMYKGMLARLGELAMLVDESSARVAKQLQKCPEAQISTSQKDITRVALDDQPGKGEESESKKQKEVITYQRRRKRDMVPVRETPPSINTKVEQFPSIGSSIEPRKSDEVKMKIVDEKREKVSPSGLRRIGPNLTSPEEDSTPVVGSVLDPEMKAIKGWDGCAAPHVGYESRVNMNGSDLQDRFPHAGTIGMGKTELVEQRRLTKSTSGTELTSPLCSQVPSCQLSIVRHHSDDVYSISYSRDASSGVTNQPLVSSSLDISQTHKDSSFGEEEERAKCAAGDNFP